MLITLFSTDIIWEDKQTNFKSAESLLRRIDYNSDIVVFPEMFSTGFTMNTSLAEGEDGESLEWMRKIAAKYNVAVVSSIPFKERVSTKERIFNRAFFVKPNGEYSFYDKRHLFRMGRESEFYSQGDKLTVIEYKGVRFALNICYDLRFPVWSRNVNNYYDVLINVANFPLSRLEVIEPLVKARAIENMAYMVFANRVGNDPDCEYVRSSLFVDYKGKNIGEEILPDSQKEGIIKGEINIDNLNKFREKFPAWMDADNFNITF